MTDGRLIATEMGDGDAPEVSLRPKTLGDFVGQPQLRANLKYSGSFISTRACSGELVRSRRAMQNSREGAFMIDICGGGITRFQ